MDKGNVDIVLVTAPYTEHYAPLPAIAILKSIAEKAGMTAKAMDLNQKYSKTITQDTNYDYLACILS